MRFGIVLIVLLCFSTAARADYCSDDRWEKAQKRHKVFVTDCQTRLTNFRSARDYFKRQDLIHRQYSHREMEAFCRNTPADCRKLFEEKAVSVEKAGNQTESVAETVDAVIKAGEALADDWHVLAGACTVMDAANLESGKKNAARVRKYLQEAREALFELKLICFLYRQEGGLLEHLEKVLQEIEAGQATDPGDN